MAEGGFFSCIFKTFLYDPNQSNSPLSVVIMEVLIGAGGRGTQPPLSEFSGSAPGFLRDFHSLYLSLCVKETKFEYEVHQKIQEERQNQPRWYFQSLSIYSPRENFHLNRPGLLLCNFEKSP